MERRREEIKEKTLLKTLEQSGHELAERKCSGSHFSITSNCQRMRVVALFLSPLLSLSDRSPIPINHVDMAIKY